MPWHVAVDCDKVFVITPAVTSSLEVSVHLPATGSPRCHGLTSPPRAQQPAPGSSPRPSLLYFNTQASGKDVKVSFTPHLINMSRYTKC